MTLNYWNRQISSVAEVFSRARCVLVCILNTLFSFFLAFDNFVLKFREQEFEYWSNDVSKRWHHWLDGLDGEKYPVGFFCSTRRGKREEEKLFLFGEKKNLYESWEQILLSDRVIPLSRLLTVIVLKESQWSIEYWMRHTIWEQKMQNLIMTTKRNVKGAPGQEIGVCHSFRVTGSQWTIKTSRMFEYK